jgi:hypothetical protein
LNDICPCVSWQLTKASPDRAGMMTSRAITVLTGRPGRGPRSFGRMFGSCGMRVSAIWLLTISVAGCGGRSGPATTDTSSASISSLDQRVEFLQRYVTFRRDYRELDFHVLYHNNGGGLVPGPSDWDIRVVAVVPPGELASWVPAGKMPVRATDVSWLVAVPGSKRTVGITEWYVESRKVVGIDRARSVMAYRCWAH